MTEAAPSLPKPESVAIVFRRRVRPGGEADYEAWLAGMNAETRAKAPGFLGVEVVRPAPGGNVYLSIFRFTSVADLGAWEASDLRKVWVGKIPAHAVEGEVEIRRHEGVEAWFTGGEAQAKTAVKWKMALVLATVVYLFILILGPIVTFVLGEDTPIQLRLAVSVSIEVSLMTWFVMPRVTKALGDWLYR